MAQGASDTIDTVIIGNGPSALILSYILHGHIPTYTAVSPSSSSSPSSSITPASLSSSPPASSPSSSSIPPLLSSSSSSSSSSSRRQPHPDPVLHAKLFEQPDLLRQEDLDYLTNHLPTSKFPYSSQALPVNALLDALLRPKGDIYDSEGTAYLRWDFQPERAVDHVVTGDAASPGGQWVQDGTDARWDIGTLSYASMLSLPGYSFAQHYLETTKETLPPFSRPSRRQVAEYFQSYPSRVGIQDSIRCRQSVSGIRRTADGFHIKSHDLRCKYLVLATGVFSELPSAPPLLQPILRLPATTSLPENPEAALLVVGSGFSAADVISSCSPGQKIVHIYQWNPAVSPSPLRACHQQAYPEYATVYRRMKRAARKRADHGRSVAKTSKLQEDVPDAIESFELHAKSNYEGFANASIADVHIEEGHTAIVTFLLANGETRIKRRINRLEYVIGRRGSLAYLCKSLRQEIHPDLAAHPTLSGQTLREKIWDADGMEVTSDVFAIGSLTGDSLIRFAFGSVVSTAGEITKRMRGRKGRRKTDGNREQVEEGMSWEETSGDGKESTIFL